jgi:GT2 family glycosyltransferase
VSGGGPRVARPDELGIRADAGLPVGSTVELDSDTRPLGDDVLFGGSPARVLRLSGAGVRALAELRAGPVASAAAATLARRLTDTGLAHPRPAPLVTAAEMTVVVPVRDRASELDRCLAAAGTEYPVLVVDDGSADPVAVAAVCAARGAQLIRRSVSGGPGPARNTALRAARTQFVAFLDSDCTAPPGWISALTGHFADPLVAAVAPRIVAAAGGEGAGGEAGTGDVAGTGGRAGTGGGDGTDGRAGTGGGGGGSPLDLGDRPARVMPLTRVAYVPTAALVVRRAALGGGFDEALRYGEDVDLVWRLTEAGWRVRYEPAVQVAHAEPASQSALLRRRFWYGTSAAPLTRRHPGAVAPLVLQPWPTITMAALLARRPLTAGAAFAASTVLLASRLRANGLPSAGVARPMAGGVWQTWLGTGRWCGQFAAPALVLALARPGGRTARTRWGRRAAAASLLLGPPLAEWARDRDTDPVRFVTRTLADQAAYGTGVYAGCLRERLITPVLPSVSWKPFEGLRARHPGRAQRLGPEPPSSPSGSSPQS